MLPFSAAKENFEETVLRSDLPVLLDFWAPWCGYCRRIAPALGLIADEFGDRLRVAKINTDEQPELTERYHVDTLPTLLLVKAGQTGEALIAPESRDQITDWLRAQGAID